jgi:hypothetical protein
MTDPMELVGRLEKVTAKPAGPGGIVRGKKRDLIEAAACIREMVERREGLEEDLYQAVSVAYARGARDWARLNYPAWIDSISARCSPLPPAPGAEDE